MARGLSIEKIQLIQTLYSSYGNYSKVAKEVGCAPSTVKKYVDGDVKKPKSNNAIESDFVELTPIEEMELPLFDFGYWGTMRDEEKDEYNSLRQEILK